MTFSPDGEFPVVNIEKGRLPGHFTASWEKSEKLPRLVSFKAGVKTNVVPGKAHAVVEGVELEVLTATAAQMEQETGIHFEFEGGVRQNTHHRGGRGRSRLYAL